jgi:RNA polymerase sigma-70 factor, ECF subfamily
VTSTISHHTEQLINQARKGDPLALGPLLESYALQLRRAAERQLDQKIRGRVSASDVVQETMYHATRDIADFRGCSDAEFASWLRRILANQIAKSVERHVLAEKRDVRREVFNGGAGGMQSQGGTEHFQSNMADHRPGPSSEAIYLERGHLINEALASLPTKYRHIVELRNLQGLPFDEIARRLNATSGAARMRWLRAIDMLRQHLIQQDAP